MNPHRRPFRCIPSLCLAVAAATLLPACGHGDHMGSAPPPGGIFAVQGNTVQPEATLAGAQPIVITGTNGANISVSIQYNDGTTEPLINDPDDRSRFWMPFVTQARSGLLTAAQAGRAIASLPVSVAPYATSAVPGEAALNFLYAHKVHQQAAIAALSGQADAQPALDLLTNMQLVTDQQIAWVTAAIKDGSTVVENAWGAGSQVLDQTGLKLMDQVTMSQVAIIRPGTVALAKPAQPFADLASALLPSANAAAVAPCEVARPLALETSQAIANDHAWCVAQVRIADAEAVATYAALAGDGVKFLGLALLMPAPPLGVGLMYSSTVIGYSSDLIDILASATNNQYGDAAAKAWAVAVKTAASAFVGGLRVARPSGVPLPTEYARALIEAVKALGDGKMGQVIDKLIADFLRHVSGGPDTPMPPGTEGFYAGKFTLTSCTEGFCPSVTYTGNSVKMELAFRIGSEPNNLRIDQDFGCITVSAPITASVGSRFGYSLSSEAPLTYPMTTEYTVNRVTDGRIEGTLTVSSSFADVNHPGASISGTSTYTWAAEKVKPFAKCLPPTKVYQNNIPLAFFCPIYGSDVDGFGCDFIPVGGPARPGEWAQ